MDFGFGFTFIKVLIEILGGTGHKKVGVQPTFLLFCLGSPGPFSKGLGRRFFLPSFFTAPVVSKKKRVVGCGEVHGYR